MLQTGMTVTAQDQALDFGLREFLAASTSVSDIQVKPLLAGRGHLELRLNSFEILRCAPLKSLFKRDLPFFFQFVIVPRKKSENRVLAGQLENSVLVGTRESSSQ